MSDESMREENSRVEKLRLLTVKLALRDGSMGGNYHLAWEVNNATGQLWHTMKLSGLEWYHIKDEQAMVLLCEEDGSCEEPHETSIPYGSYILEVVTGGREVQYKWISEDEARMYWMVVE